MSNNNRSPDHPHHTPLIFFLHIPSFSMETGAILRIAMARNSVTLEAAHLVALVVHVGQQAHAEIIHTNATAMPTLQLC